MEKQSPSTLYHSFSLVEQVRVLLYDTIFIWVSMLQKFSSGFLGSHVEFGMRETRSHVERSTPCEARGGHELITREDVEMVFESMGLAWSPEGEKLKERMAFNELSTMFEEKEPSLEEMKAAFAVFDENRDGSIDAAELRRVLSKLGFREGVELDACKQMIAAHDEDRDGKIDFHEFVKFMESSFC